MNIIYVGYFKMPDGTASAQLIRGMAKIAVTAGYNVVIIDVGIDDSISRAGEKTYEIDEAKVVAIRYPKSIKGEVLKRLSFKTIKKHIPDGSVVMFYNYSSLVMLKSFIYRKKGYISIPIITEWYSAGEIEGIKSFFSCCLKKIDIDLRMCIVSKIAPGIIVASKYLENYYKSHCKTLVIPTVINYEQKKWYQDKLDFNQKEINFVYAGSPGKKKDNLTEIIRLIDEASEGVSFTIRIVGVSRDEFLELHPDDLDVADNKHCIFMGYLPHEKCIQVILSSDYSILYRENNRVSNAGFPTKFAESMACGIPQIVTDTSDIRDYIKEDKNGILLSFDKMKAVEQIKRIFLSDRYQIDENKKYIKEIKLFDYHNYVEPMREFINGLISK